LAAWIGAAVLLAAMVPPKDPRKSPEPPLLPADSPSCRADEAMVRYFPQRSGRSEAAIIFERPGGALTAADYAAIESVARRLLTPTAQANAADLAGVEVLSPRALEAPPNLLTGQPMWRNLLVSPVSSRGQAALVLAAFPSNFIAMRTDRLVAHTRSVVEARPLPAGLSAAVTGSAGFGHDYVVAARISHRRTIQVTLVAVVVILLIVYRSPVAPLVPLSAISLAAVVAIKGLALADRFGLHVGTAEDIFVFVLLYGAGVDYTLLLVSRYRELLAAGADPPRAAAESLTRCFPTIVASACTVTAGLAMMSFARYGFFRTAGPAVAAAVVTAMLASVTLAPAIVGILGAKLFWPMRAGLGQAVVLPSGRRFELWPALARAITGRPILMLTVTLVVLAAPAANALRITWVYDTLASIKAYEHAGLGGAARGLEMAKQHWPAGEIAPVTLLIKAASPLDPPQWDAVARQITQAVRTLPHVSDVRSINTPLGTSENPATNLLVQSTAGATVGPEYLSADGTAMRMTVLLDQPALTLQAMASLRDILHVASATVTKLNLHASVLAAGSTAEMADIRTVTRGDFHRIALLALAAIFLIVLALLRDPLLSAFMVGSTLLSYLATLGLSGWLWTSLMGQPGLDWKVEVFLFVVMVAVGQDYNIFLAARLAQEAVGATVLQATRRAMVSTGPVISSCGLIMAATLGSLMGGQLLLLQQLGSALAMGMLIDTFVVRPLLLPAFVAATGRTGKSRLIVTPNALPRS
jgi:RND superfamily putative drug exporter